MKLLIFACLLAASSLYSVGYSYPVHASCKLTWDFNMNCSAVQDKLVAQVKAWTGTDMCPTKGQGEKCGYDLKSQTAAQLKTTHTTPVKHYVDDQTFDFTSSTGSCTVQGFSTSETWYAVLDYGTNYCNMHNLVTGSHLDLTPGFKETASDSDCTQYSSANCDVY